MKIAKEKTSREYLRVIILTIVCISYVPVFVLAVFSYISTKKILQDEMIQSGAANLNQTVNAVEIILNQTFDGCRQLSTDAVVSDFLSFGAWDYYEKLDITLSERERLAYAEYFQRKQKTIRQIAAAKASNRYIKNIYLYNFDNNLVLADHGGTYTADELGHTRWKEAADNAAFFPLVVPSDQYNTNREGAKTITLLFSNQDALRVKRFVFVVILDADIMYDHVLKRIDSQRQSDYIVFSSDHDLMVGRNISGRDRERLSEAAAAVGKSGTFLIDRLEDKKEVYFVSFQQSDSLGWTIFNIRNADKVFQSLRYICFALVLSFFSIAAVLLVLIRYSVRKLYSPVKLILSLVKGEPVKEESLKILPNGEIGIISRSIREAWQKRAYLETQLAESMPVYKERFLISMVKRTHITEKEAEEKIRFHAIGISLYGLVPILASGINFREGKVEDQYLELIRLKGLLSETLHMRYRCETCEDDKGRILILLNCRQEGIKELDLFLENTCVELESVLQYPVVMGAGRWCKGRSVLKEACRQAEEALIYGVFQGISGVYRLDELPFHSGGMDEHSDEKVEQIVNVIRSGDGGRAEHLFMHILRELAVDGRTDRYNVHNIFLKLLSGLMQVAEEARIELEEAGNKETSLIDRINTHSETETIQWFKSIINRMAGCMKNKLSENEARYIEKLMGLLDKDCGRAVSLEWAAEALHLNPAYLSRIFRETTGNTFIEYVTRTRVDKAKKLLLETDMKIKDMAGLLGYANDNYFIQVFRKHTGVTPKDFREARNNMA